MIRNRIAGCLLLGSLAVGCGSTGTADVNYPFSGVFTGSGAPINNVRTRTITIIQPTPEQLVRDGDRPDTVDIEGFDAAGNRVFGPVRVALAGEMKVPNVPDETVRLQLDYLRNGGYMLFRADAGLTNKDNSVVPLMQLITLEDTNFKVVPNGAGFVVKRLLTGTPPSGQASAKADVAGKLEDGAEETFKIKGVCYSPSPINFSNKDAPAVGDLFWDTFKAGSDSIYGWAALYLNFYDPSIGNSRADLDKIRALGANTIRLYSSCIFHLGDKGEFVDQTTAHRFSHKEFLDACFDHGSPKSLAVLVDIPMPDVCFRYTLKEALDQPPELRAQIKAQRAQQVAWWESNFRATVEDLSKHPAVIGFNIMNEQDGADWCHPNQGTGPDNAETQYFYAQSKKYADMVKEIDKNKLCGWAFHDSPDLVIFGKNFPASGPKYLEQLSSFDFWGINAYQTVNLDAITGPGFRGSYSDLPASMKKPVLLTELGWPSTGHDNNNALVDNAGTQANTAATISRMFPQVYANPMYMGACYFEFSDEWWKQPQGTNSTWDPGNSEPAFPNHFWDEEGFGLYSVSRQGGRPNNDLNFVTFGPDPTAAFGSKGPKMPYDLVTPRLPVIDALKSVFQSTP